ncbi:unnamed protein product [Mytilus coruscus]|uniref:Apple domain-containing protein n=1 Tax=Mytilus coruscus TaxID=42192 RepID=A0A6J8CB79_MYTCO|nr:unnamed protein product [Mytilus coruscus]
MGNKIKSIGFLLCLLLVRTLCENGIVKIHRDKIFNGHVMFEASMPTWLPCAELCSRIQACKSINFIAWNKNCQMNNDEPGNHNGGLVETVGTTFVAESSFREFDNVSTKSDLALAQLLMFNQHSNTQNVSHSFRHSAYLDTPFVRNLDYLSAKTRKRQLMIHYFNMGNASRTDRVLQISTQLGETEVERYLNEGYFCPLLLKGKVFYHSWVDNIDHNQSSTTSKSSFHGTGISIFQHPMKENVGVGRDQIMLPTSKPKGT